MEDGVFIIVVVENIKTKNKKQQKPCARSSVWGILRKECERMDEKFSDDFLKYLSEHEPEKDLSKNISEKDLNRYREQIEALQKESTNLRQPDEKEFDKIIREGIEKTISHKEILLDAVKMAYRKHWLNDESIGWDELGDILHNAICNVIGDDGYMKWKDIERGRGD